MDERIVKQEQDKKELRKLESELIEKKYKEGFKDYMEQRLYDLKYELKHMNPESKLTLVEIDKLIRGKQFKGGEFCYMITKDKAGYQKLNENSSMTALIKMYKEYKNISAMEKVLGSDIFKEAEKDEDIKAIINEWYGNIARMIYNVSSMLNPEKILIGGGVSAREELISELQNALNEIPWWKHVSCTIEKCKHENDAGLIGAAYNFINP